nr:MAG TPA: hypothetical protein [Caudoviricetes sp.]
MQDAGPHPKTGHHSTHHSRHSIRPQSKRQGGRQHTDGGHQHSTGRPATPPPFTHHATHHPQRHPTIHDGPTLHHDEGGVDRGYPTTRTVHTNTHHPHTTRPARDSARHDSSTRQHRNGMSRARATPLHRAGQQQHTRFTAIPHTEEDGHHPLIHSSTLTHSRSHNR